MSEESVKVSVTGNLTVTGLLGIVFVVLKLTGFIDWGWLWVLLPFWGPLSLFLFGMVVYVLFAMIRGWIRGHRKGRRKR